jgi:DNA-binding transcriptional LysR family regulator
MTEAGDRLVEHARRILRQVDIAADDLAAMAGLRAGRLTIGASRTVGSLDLSGLLAEFHRRHPAVDLAVREDLSVTLAEGLRADEVDLAFITRPGGPDGDGLELRVVSVEPLVAILAPDHRLARRRRLRVALLEGETMVTFREGATIRWRLEEAAARAGYNPRLAFETNEVGRMRALAAAGLAIAILPRSDAELPGPPIKAVPFQEPEFRHTVYMATRAQRHHSPATRAFIELTLAEQAATEADGEQAATEADGGQAATEADGGQAATEADAGQAATEADAGQAATEADAGQAATEADAGQVATEAD